MIIVYSGLPGSGKSTCLAEMGFHLLLRNRRMFKKTGHIRKVCSNIKFSPSIESRFSDFIYYWKEATEVPTFRDCDVLIDELAIYFDAQNWADTSMELKRYLRLHRHYNVNIYGVAQDFDTVDIAFRRLTATLYTVTRIIGTREPSVVYQPKYPFLVSLVREVDRRDFEKKKEEYRYVSFSLPTLFTKEDFDVFDTHEVLSVSNVIPMKHIKKVCPDCGKEVIVHR